MNRYEKIKKGIDAIAAGLAACTKQRKEGRYNQSEMQTEINLTKEIDKDAKTMLKWTKRTFGVNAAMLFVAVTAGLIGAYLAWPNYINLVDPGEPRFVVNITEIVAAKLKQPANDIDKIINNYNWSNPYRLRNSNKIVYIYYDRGSYYYKNDANSAEISNFDFKDFVETKSFNLGMYYEKSGGEIKDEDIEKVKTKTLKLELLDLGRHNPKESATREFKIGELIKDRRPAPLLQEGKVIGYTLDITAAVVQKPPIMQGGDAKYLKISTY